MESLDLPPKGHFPIKKESEEQQSSKFSIRNGEVHPTSVALPLELRQEAIESFDSETSQFKRRSEDVIQPRGDQDEVSRWIESAQILYANEEWQPCIAILSRVVQVEPENIRAIQLLGMSFLFLKEVEQAEQCFVELDHLTSESAILFNLASLLYENGFYKQALERYESALLKADNDGPTVFDAYKNMGNIYIHLGELDKAEEHYNKAFTLNPDSDVLLVNYGTLAIQRGDLEKAKERFRQAVYLNENNDKAWVGLGLIHREFGDHELGWANIERAFDINPKNETALELALDWGVKDNRLSNLIVLIENYLHDNDEDRSMNLILSELLFMAGRFDQAKFELDRLIQVDPKNEVAKTLLEQVGQAQVERERRF